MHKHFSEFLWMKTPLSLQHPLPSKKQIIVNSEAINQRILTCIFKGIPLISMELLAT